MVTSRRRQHELLGSYPGWALTSIMLAPPGVAQAQKAGWSRTGELDPATGRRVVGTREGFGFCVDSSREPVEVIPWSELTAITREVPEGVRAELVDFGERWREHQSAYPCFTASVAAIGCGRSMRGEPLTERQEASRDELQAFDASGALQDWEQRRAELHGERLGLHARALAPRGGDEAGDLLDLLDEQHADLAPVDPVPAADRTVDPPAFGHPRPPLPLRPSSSSCVARADPASRGAGRDPGGVAR